MESYKPLEDMEEGELLANLLLLPRFEDSQTRPDFVVRRRRPASPYWLDEYLLGAIDRNAPFKTALRKDGDNNDGGDGLNDGVKGKTNEKALDLAASADASTPESLPRMHFQGEKKDLTSHLKSKAFIEFLVSLPS